MQNLIFIGTGFGIVLSVLAVLWAICSSVGAVFVRMERNKVTQQNSPPIPYNIPAAHVAAITAAVASLSSPYRIVRVTAPPHVASVWTVQGRLGQHAERRTRMTWAAPGHRPRLETLGTQNDGGKN